MKLNFMVIFLISKAIQIENIEKNTKYFANLEKACRTKTKCKQMIKLLLG